MRTLSWCFFALRIFLLYNIDTIKLLLFAIADHSTAMSGVAKKTKMNKKLSSEFAIAVILIIAGTFTYIFWKGAGNISIDNTETISFEKKENSASIKPAKGEWKIFRNTKSGYEFSLPESWKLEEASGKFATQDKTEEMRVLIEKNTKQYSTEELLAESMKADAEASIQPLDGAIGIRIEKQEADVLNQTARIIQGEDLITLTYVSQDADSAETPFDQILATFKALN